MKKKQASLKKKRKHPHQKKKKQSKKKTNPLRKKLAKKNLQKTQLLQKRTQPLEKKTWNKKHAKKHQNSPPFKENLSLDRKTFFIAKKLIKETATSQKKKKTKQKPNFFYATKKCVFVSKKLTEKPVLSFFLPFCNFVSAEKS